MAIQALCSFMVHKLQGSLTHTNLRVPVGRWDAFSKSHICMTPPHQTTEHFSSRCYPSCPTPASGDSLQRKLASGTSQVNFTLYQASDSNIGYPLLISWYVSLYSSNERLVQTQIQTKVEGRKEGGALGSVFSLQPPGASAFIVH